MKIGIFGDSFGDWDLHSNTKEWSWPALVAQHLKADCVNYCKAGSALFYSYKKFLEYHSSYDKVIFLLTNPGRYTKSFIFPSYAVPGTMEEYHINGLLYTERWLASKKLTDQDTARLNDLKGFYMSQDYQWDLLSCKLLVSEISRQRPDTLLIPCFHQYAEQLGSVITMEDLMRYQLDRLGCSLSFDKFFRKYVENPNSISCHFTKETNQFVARQIVKSFEINKWDIGQISIEYQTSFEQSYIKLT